MTSLHFLSEFVKANEPNVVKKSQFKSCKGAKSMSPVEEGSGGSTATAASIVGAETDAMTALNTALKGVDALKAVITLMTDSAGSIVSATEDGKTAVKNHVTSTEVKQEIGKVAGDAAMQEIFKQISSVTDAVLEELDRRGYSSTV
jgi:hypothetical protein